ncbi:MAG: T9SS type A sorting domain-containing protein [Paludibacter sp.]
MKKQFLLICMVAASVLSAFADKTIYVAPVSAGDGSGLDASNPTTFAQALGALDATGYTTFVLPNSGYFLFNETPQTGVYARISLPDNSKIIIEGNNSTLEGNGAKLRLLRASTGCRIHLRNLTFRLGDSDNSVGGAIFFAGDSLKISGCTFDSNASGNGGAIGCRGGNYVKISNSSFKNNYLSNSYQGAAISHTGSASGGTLIVENTTFSNNLGRVNDAVYGSAIITAFDGTTRNYLNTISVSNCTFYKNRAGKNNGLPGFAAVDLSYLGATAPAGTATTATFVNNTFYGNSNCSIKMWGKQQALRLFNNVIVGDEYAVTSVTGIQDHGIITEFSVAEGRPAIVAKNNYIACKVPLSSKIDDAAFATGNSDNNTKVVISSQNDIDVLALSTTLQTSGSAVPYLAITSSSSPLVERGISSMDGIIIPATDARGITRGSGSAGSSFDIGAYEFNNHTTTTVEGVSKGVFTLTQTANEISVAGASSKISVNVYLPNGQLICSKAGNNAITINKAQLPKGLLIFIVNDGQKSVAQKVII